MQTSSTLLAECLIHHADSSMRVDLQSERALSRARRENLRPFRHGAAEICLPACKTPRKVEKKTGLRPRASPAPTAVGPPNSISHSHIEKRPLKFFPYRLTPSFLPFTRLSFFVPFHVLVIPGSCFFFFYSCLVLFISF